MNSGIIQDVLDLDRGEPAAGRRIIDAVCDKLLVPDASRRLIGELLDRAERPMVPMASVYRQLGITYRTWRRKMTTDERFKGIKVVHLGGRRGAMLYADEVADLMEAIK